MALRFGIIVFLRRRPIIDNLRTLKPERRGSTPKGASDNLLPDGDRLTESTTPPLDPGSP